MKPYKQDDNGNTTIITPTAITLEEDFFSWCISPLALLVVLTNAVQVISEAGRRKREFFCCEAVAGIVLFPVLDAVASRVVCLLPRCHFQ